MENPISTTKTCTANYQEVFDFTDDYSKDKYSHICVQVVGAANALFSFDQSTVAFQVVSNGSIVFDKFPLLGKLYVKDDGTGVAVYVNCW